MERPGKRLKRQLKSFIGNYKKTIQAYIPRLLKQMYEQVLGEESNGDVTSCISGWTKPGQKYTSFHPNQSPCKLKCWVLWIQFSYLSPLKTFAFLFWRKRAIYVQSAKVKISMMLRFFLKLATHTPWDPALAAGGGGDFCRRRLGRRSQEGGRVALGSQVAKFEDLWRTLNQKQNASRRPCVCGTVSPAIRPDAAH